MWPRYLFYLSLFCITLSIESMHVPRLTRNLTRYAALSKIKRAGLPARRCISDDKHYTTVAATQNNTSDLLQKRIAFLDTFKDKMPALPDGDIVVIPSAFFSLLACVTFGINVIGYLEGAPLSKGALTVSFTVSLLSTLLVGVFIKYGDSIDKSYTEKIREFKALAQALGISSTSVDTFLAHPELIASYKQQLQTDENLQKLLEQLNNQKKLCAAQCGKL